MGLEGHGLNFKQGGGWVCQCAQKFGSHALWGQHAGAQIASTRTVDIEQQKQQQTK